MALKDVIKAARLKKNLKQEEAAEMVGVTVQTYSKWENGKTEPKASQISKMSTILGISTDEICNGELSQKLDLIEFMKIVSEVSRTINDFELKMAIWESIDNDYKFIDNLRKYSSTPDRYLLQEENPDPATLIYDAEKIKDPDYYDENIEALKGFEEQQAEEEFLTSLTPQEIESYEKAVSNK